MNDLITRIRKEKPIRDSDLLITLSRLHTKGDISDKVYKQLEANYYSDRHSNEKRHKELLMKAYTDPVTGILRRDAIEDIALMHSKDYSIAYLDIDDFKNVNETLGHPYGDKVLRHVGDILRLSTRKDTLDCPIRLGGEEMILFLPDTSGYDAYFIAERVRRKISSPESMILFPELDKLTASIGVAEWKEGMGIYDVLKAADDYMLDVKHNKGKDRTCYKSLDLVPVSRYQN
jgi:diguanylate cyclase (GGDEF)-like protein